MCIWYCLGYVYDFALRPELLAPGVWTLAWVLHLSVAKLVPNLKERWKHALWALPLIAILLGAPQREKAVLLVLAVLNVSIFSWIYLRGRIPLALHFALISLVAVVGGLPEEWGTQPDGTIHPRNLHRWRWDDLPSDLYRPNARPQAGYFGRFGCCHFGEHELAAT